MTSPPTTPQKQRTAESHYHNGGVGYPVNIYISCYNLSPASSPLAMPHKFTQTNNFMMMVEIPLEITQSTQITWSMTHHSTPLHPIATPGHIPDPPGDRNPVSPGPLLALCPSQPQSASSAISTGVFGDLVAEVRTAEPNLLSTFTSKSESPVKSESPHRQPAWAGVIPQAQPTSLSPCRSRPCGTTHSTGTFRQNIEIPMYDNEKCELDPSWPHPIYPHEPGQSHPDDPLPNITIAPKKYYLITKGLCLGVYYDEW